MKHPHIHIIAYHGWGISKDAWKPWQKFFSDSIQFDAADRGYFGKPFKPIFNPSCNKKVVFAHSFGLHWCDQALLKEADLLVLFSGFLKFHPEPKKQEQNSILKLQQMMGRFVEKPVEVLQTYYKDLFHPNKPLAIPEGSLNHELLLEDLSLLHTSEIGLQILHQVPFIKIFHGSEDKIIPKKSARDLYHQLRHRSQYYEILHKGHSLAFTDADSCYPILKPEFEPAEIDM
jgi:pimeloyl-[acyl-carrier protein] methyl ester esterase